MRSSLLALALFLAGCSSVNKPPTPNRPEVDVVQQSAIFFGSAGEAPLNLAISIRNPAKEPIEVRRIRLTAGMGMMQFSVRPAERFVKEPIAPGDTKEIDLTATAYTDRVRLTPTEPLSLRVTVDYDLAGKRHQELYLIMGIGQ